MSAATTIPTTAGRGSQAAQAKTSLTTLVAVELRKMVDTRSGRWLLIGIGLALVAILVIVAATGSPADRTFRNLASVAQFPIAIVLPVLGVLAATSEWGQRTVLSTFALTPSRGRIITAKVLAAVILAVVAYLLAFVAAVVISLLASVLGTAETDWTFGVSEFAQYLVFDILNMLLGVALGMALLSSGLAIVTYFILPQLWSGLVLAFNLDGIRNWLDTGTSWIHLVDDGMAGNNWLQVFTTSLLWIALPLAIGTARILRKEVD